MGFVYLIACCKAAGTVGNGDSAAGAGTGLSSGTTVGTTGGAVEGEAVGERATGAVASMGVGVGLHTVD